MSRTVDHATTRHVLKLTKPQTVSSQPVSCPRLMTQCFRGYTQPFESVSLTQMTLVPVVTAEVPSSVAPKYRVIQKDGLNFLSHHHHHHHHVQEGLGLIPVPCILKMKLVPPSLPRSSYVSSSFWFIL